MGSSWGRYPSELITPIFDWQSQLLEGHSFILVHKDVFKSTAIIYFTLIM
jgi:hypothetical protein